PAVALGPAGKHGGRLPDALIAGYERCCWICGRPVSDLLDARVEGTLLLQPALRAPRAAGGFLPGGNLMRRLIFGLVVVAGVAAFSQSGAGANASTGNAGAST